MVIQVLIHQHRPLLRLHPPEEAVRMPRAPAALQPQTIDQAAQRSRSRRSAASASNQVRDVANSSASARHPSAHGLTITPSTRPTNIRGGFCQPTAHSIALRSAPRLCRVICPLAWALRREPASRSFTSSIIGPDHRCYSSLLLNIWHAACWICRLSVPPLFRRPRKFLAILENRRESQANRPHRKKAES